MSQAEALLNSLAGNVVDHKHEVPDSDTHFIVDPYTRQIENTNYQKTVLMRGDHNSERFTFEVPRYVDGHDMSLCNRVIVHFDNVGDSIENVYSDVAYMDDLRINPDKPDTVISSWLIRREATQIVGILSFSLQYQCVENEEITYEWNTDSYDDIEIRKSKNNGEAAVIQYTNVLEEWRSKIFGAGDSVMTNITTEGANQVTAVKNESASQQAAIELKGSETLATIPEEYTEVYNMANEALRTKGDSVTCDAEGSVITINDSSDDHVRGLKVYGKTTQIVTTGAQVLPQPYYDVDKTSSGVKFTVNPDGSITISGTSTATDLASCYFTLNSGLNLNGVYTYKCYGLPDSCVTNIYYIGDITGESVRTMNLIEGTSYGFVIRVKPNANVNVTVYPMLVEGDTIKPYESYTAGTIAPNPEYPQDLISVENPVVTIYGRQLLDVYTKASNNVELTANNEVCEITNLTTNRYGNTVFRTTLGPGIYTVAVDSFEGNIIDEGHLIKLSDDTANVYLTSLTTAQLNRSFTISKNTTIKVEIYSGNTTIGGKYVIRGLRIYSGTEPHPWKPYFKPQTIQLTNTLRGIPISDSGTYVDRNGSQWIRDEVDFERGVLIKRIERIVVDGTAEWHPYNYQTQYYGFHIWDLLDEQHTRSLGLCNQFETVGGSDKDCLWVGVNNKNIYAISKEWYDKGLDAWKAHLNEMPLEIIYARKTPIEIPLTAEEILAYKSLKTNYPHTTILNNAGAWMKAKYNVDMKLYIAEMADNRAASMVEEVLNEEY